MRFARFNSVKAAWMAACAFAALTPAVRAGDVNGKAVYDNANRPQRMQVDFAADPKCAAMHTTAMGTEDFMIKKDTLEIQNVFVYLKDIKGDFKAPDTAAVIDQKGCMYTPHVQGIMAGQKVTIRNSDSTMHNIHWLGKANPEFNQGQPTPGDMAKDFRKPEMAGHFKCDVHPWMSAYMFVMDHPFFAVTAADGTFSIKGVPAGEYTLVAWHEKLGEKEQKIKVEAGPLGDLKFTFSGTGAK